jgi:hypothetical protein
MQLYKLSTDPQGCLADLARTIFPRGGQLWVDGGLGCQALVSTGEVWRSVNSTCSNRFTYACEFNKKPKGILIDL